jgi:hypothetical protein
VTTPVCSVHFKKALYRHRTNAAIMSSVRFIIAASERKDYSLLVQGDSNPASKRGAALKCSFGLLEWIQRDFGGTASSERNGSPFGGRQ